MNLSYDELLVHATHHQAELRQSAEVARIVRRELKPGRTFRIVPPATWPRSVRVAANEEIAA